MLESQPKMKNLQAWLIMWGTTNTDPEINDCCDQSTPLVDFQLHDANLFCHSLRATYNTHPVVATFYLKG